MMKKLVALLMALALLCSSIGVFAEEETVVEPVEAAAEAVVEEATEEPALEGEEEPEAPAEPEKKWDVVLGEHYADKDDKTENCKAPTCEEEGYDEYVCQDPACTVKTFKIILPAKGHKAPEGAGSEITKPATCTETGLRTWDDCVNCKKPWVEVIGELGHAWEQKKDAEGKVVVVEPTCTDKGYTVYECSRCGAEKHDDTKDALGHEWAVCPTPTTDDPLIWTEVDSASCVDGGKLVKFTFCERCHIKNIVSEESTYWEPLDHQDFLEKFITKPADVKAEDYITWLLAKVAEADVKTDSLAGTDAEDDIIVCDGHQIETTKDSYKAFHHPVEITVEDPTCTEKGLLTLACTECPAKVEVVIPATGHSYDYYAVEGSKPTCLEDGKLMVYCTNDGCDYEEQIDVAAPGKHNFAEGAASYSQQKYGAKVDHGTIDQIAKCIDYTAHFPCLGHTVTFTLSTGDEFTYTSTCDKEHSEQVPGDGKHDKATENYAYRDSTCTEEGYEYFYCNACGYTYGQKIPMKKHTLVYKVIDKPTCTEDGLAHWDCSVCKQTIETQVLPMTGHDYQITEHKDETCTEDGYDLYTCTYCGDNYKETIAKHHTAPLPQDIKPGANNNQAYKAPTCTATGLQSYECTVCHQPVIDEVIPALGHVYDLYGDKSADTIIVDGEIWNTYTPATCKNEAYYTRTCLRCGKKETKKVGEKLGHLMAAWNSDGTAKVNSLVLDTSNLPTCESTGKAYYNCAICGKLVEDFVMPQLPCNEWVVWNPEKRVYEITCVEAEWDLWDELMDGYLWDEIAACTEDEALASKVYDEVMTELKKKLMQKDDEYIPGIGCGATTEIPVIKTHYDIALKDGVVTLTPDENCVLLKKPMIIVNWAYTMSDGTAFSYTRLFREEEVGSLTFDLGLAETPVGAVLESITMIVTDTVTLDITEAMKGYGVAQITEF